MSRNHRQGYCEALGMHAGPRGLILSELGGIAVERPHGHVLQCGRLSLRNFAGLRGLRERLTHLSSSTSFSLFLLISSIFLISSSVSFWISSSERFSSSSLIFLSFIAFLMASLPSRRMLRTAVRCSSRTLCRCFTIS